MLRGAAVALLLGELSKAQMSRPLLHTTLARADVERSRHASNYAWLGR